MAQSRVRLSRIAAASGPFVRRGHQVLDRVRPVGELLGGRREVGFTRIEPVIPNLHGEFDLGVQSLVLGLTTD